MDLYVYYLRLSHTPQDEDKMRLQKKLLYSLYCNRCAMTEREKKAGKHAQ